MSGGFGANTGEMVSTASAINGLAEPVTELKAKITSPAAQGGDFGKANSGSGAAYTSGLQALAGWIDDHAQAMRDYASRLEQAANSYSWSDSSATSGVNKAGANT